MRRFGLSAVACSSPGAANTSCLPPLSSAGEVERLATNAGVSEIVLPETVLARDRGLRSWRGDGSLVKDLEFRNMGRPLAMLSPDAVVRDDMPQLTARE